MTKQFLSLLLALVLLLCAAVGLGEQASSLSAAKINAMRNLAGDGNTPWEEGTRPTPDMNALQIWQWTDWFLSSRVRSLLGTIQDVEQLAPDKPLDPQTEDVQWQLREVESVLSRFETQLEDDRQAILNGIRLYQSSGTSEADRLNAVSRTLEAESELRQIIKTICGNYETYLARVDECSSRLDSQNASSVLEEHRDRLAAAAGSLENLENAANADFVVSVISAHQFRIQVLGPTLLPVKNAQVTVTNQNKKSKKVTATTDDRGNADFWVSDMGADEKSEMELNVCVTANGMRTREVLTAKLRGGDTNTFYMRKDDGKPYLIMGCFNGRDILDEMHTFYYTEKNLVKHTFSAKVSCGTSGTLKMCYRSDKGEIVLGEKAFAASDSGKTVLEFREAWLSKLKPGTQVYFKIVTKDKVEYVFNTHLNIQNAIVEEPFFSDNPVFTFFSGHGGYSFKLPDLPFIGSSSLSVDIPGNLPQFVLLPSGQGMFAWGRDFQHEDLKWESQDAKDQARAAKEFQAKSKTDMLLAKAGAYRNTSTTTEAKMLGNMGAHVTPFVALQGLYRQNDQRLEMSGNAGATLAFRAGFTQTFTMGPVPFFAGVDFSMGISFGVAVTMDVEAKIENGALKLRNCGISYGSGFGIDIRLELGGTIGMGLQDVASVALRGYGYMNPVVKFTPDASATATLGMGMTVTLRLLFLKWQDTLCDIHKNLTDPLAANAPTTAEYQHFDNTGAAPPLLPQTNDTSYGSSGVEPIEKKQVFSQLDCATGDFQYVVIGGQTYLFWIQPGSERHQARLNWYNLTDMSQHGEVTWTAGVSCKRQSFADYDFTVEGSRGINNKPSNYCALTILSGSFSGTGTEDHPELPEQSIMTTVLMQQNSKNGLDIVYYHEDADNIYEYGSYPIMPEVFLSATDEIDSVYLVSTYIETGRPKMVNGILYIHLPDGPKGINRVIPFFGNQADNADIARYHVGIPSVAKQPISGLNIYSLNENGDLSRLYYNGSRQRDMLAQGDIVNFRVYTQHEGSTVKDTLFYLERVEQEDGKYIHRLKSVTLDLSDRIVVVSKPDYDVEISTDRFDIVKFGSGVYLYWTECSTPTGKSAQDAKEEYLVRCVRYDPATDSICGPFSLVELAESPVSIKLQDSGTGYYSVDLQNSQGSYLRQSFSQFKYKLVSAAELTAAVPKEPNVCAGDYVEMAFTVRNTGNVPLSGFNVKVYNGTTEVQTLHVDCSNPNNNTNTFGTREMKGEYTVSRIGNMYDPLNHDSWEIRQTNPNGTTTIRLVKTTMLMPGDTHSYIANLLIPASWEGEKSLVAQLSSVEGDVALNGSVENGVLMLTGVNNTNDLSLLISRPDTGKQMLNTDVHDLSLSAQPFRLDGEDYVHINIMNLSGNTASSVTPILTTSYRGESLFRHAFVHTMGDDFGYAMDIPLRTLTKGRRLQELDLHVSTAGDYDEFVDSDNHVRLLLTVQLCIVEQPQSIPAAVGKEAVFSVTAAGGEKPYRYQWQRMTEADQWKDIPGANQDTYRIASVKEDQDGLTVRCVITDQLGDSVISDSATLSILPQTGDSSQVMLWLLLALASVAALVAVGCKRRSR